MFNVIEGRTVIDSREYIIYGIRNGEYSVRDISSDLTIVGKLADCFNKHGLDALHLNDIIEDFLNR